MKDVGKTNSSWWLAIPGISPFIKSLIKGRSMIQQIFQRSKFNELLQGELVSRKLHVTKLTMEYHIHDLVGSDQVERYVKIHPPSHSSIIREVGGLWLCQWHTLFFGCTLYSSLFQTDCVHMLLNMPEHVYFQEKFITVFGGFLWLFMIIIALHNCPPPNCSTPTSNHLPYPPPCILPPYCI